MADYEQQILDRLSAPHYKPLKPKALAGQLGVDRAHYAEFRRALKRLFGQGRAQLGKNQTVRLTEPHGTLTGRFRRLSSGAGVVKPDAGDPAEVHIPAHLAADAATDDVVMVRVLRKPNRRYDTHVGEVMQVTDRAAGQYVGTYFERDGRGFVRADGTAFTRSILVGDPGAKGAKPDDQVVIELLRYPTAGERGEGVIVEVLGRRGEPGVDELTVIRAFNLPDEFPAEALAEARVAADSFREDEIIGREDFTADLVITIDPADARDFDDAVSLRRTPRGLWELTVHIADVAAFVPPGGPLDAEARQRGTSVYLPGRVIPMLPELISNGLASLQQGKVRYVKSAVMEFDDDGTPVSARFANGAIRVRRRFTYEQVQEFLDGPNSYSPEELSGDLRELLTDMRDLAMAIRRRRARRGALELSMPEAVLEYGGDGRVSGAHFAEHDVSHQIIEEFMLSANEAAAGLFRDLKFSTVRRVHPAPEPKSLEKFATFARLLGYELRLPNSRFELQRVLKESLERGEQPAVHFALLRSLKQAVYSPELEGHYALASEDYLHFTSPIRRYPDLIVHRMLGQWLRSRKRPGFDPTELAKLAGHCTRAERRAEKAERELTKLKLLLHLAGRVGERMEALITGVTEHGFYAQGVRLPAEGMVHVSGLGRDYFHFDEDAHTLIGTKAGREYRLGDRVEVEIEKVDVAKRRLDFGLVDGGSARRERGRSHRH